MTSVENREYQLGTMIGWDGKASDLIKESAYDERSAKKHGGCAGKGVGCKLCELSSPLNQETMCSNAIVQCQVGNLTDCALIDHSPIGCSGENSKFNLSMHNGLRRRGKPLQNTLNISTNLKEKDMVFGASTFVLSAGTSGIVVTVHTTSATKIASPAASKPFVLLLIIQPPVP